jgi:UDP-N-acetylmuramate-alanine ligase
MVHADARVVAGLEEAVEILETEAQTDDVVLTLGAGDGYLIGERLLERLRDRVTG